ncbi:phosphatase PAP2 family protein, partial [Nostoc sp. NIES-2111]
LQMLGAGGAARPAVATLVASCILVGQMVGMHWKWHFQRARPAQVYPALTPVIPTPPHASYPSNHALQSQLARLALTALFTDAAVRKAVDGALDALADRIATNREVAGVHFQSDTRAGQKLAADILPLLRSTKAYRAVEQEARAELAGLKAMGKPLAPAVPRRPAAKGGN